VGIIERQSGPFSSPGAEPVHAEARQALLRLAERTGALLATTLRAKDLLFFACASVQSRLIRTLSTPVAVDLIAQSDLHHGIRGQPE